MTTTTEQQQPSSSPTPATEGPSGLPGFRPPPAPPGPDPLPQGATITDPTTPTPATEGPSEDVAGDVDEDDWSTPTTTPASGRSRTSTADPLVFVEIFRMVIGAVSLGVRAVRQRRLGPENPLPPGAWLAGEDDQAAIGDPLARIAARHAPISGKGSEDVADGLAAVVATTAYGLAGLEAEAKAGWGTPVDVDQAAAANGQVPT